MELHVPPVVAPGHRSRRLHRQRLLHPGLPRGANPGAHQRGGDAGQPVELHRPRPLRGRVPGQRHQAGLRLGRARRRPPRDRRLVRDQPARGLHRGRARGDGAHQERAHAGAAGRGAGAGRARTGGAAGRDGEIVDVAIVGAGPAGIAAAVGARAAGPSYALLEQDTVGGADRALPAAKGGHDRAGQPAVSSASSGVLSWPRRTCSRRCERVIADARDRGPRKGEGRVGSTGPAGDFLLTSSRGVLRARRVVLAIGRRGTPRRAGRAGGRARRR